MMEKLDELLDALNELNGNICANTDSLDALADALSEFDGKIGEPDGT